MAYADRDTAQSRMVAMIVVAIIVVGVGYAFITGLAVDFAKKVNKNLNVFDVAPPPPPPPPELPPPPPPPDQHLQPPPVVTPPPIVQTPSVAPVIQSVPTPPPVYIPTPTAPPPSPPAPPPAPRVSQAASPRAGDIQRVYGDPSNYPPGAARAGAAGRVAARLSIGPDGRVTDCSISASSGNDDLDSQTCRIAKSRVRFTPAKDDSGNPIASTYPLSVRWVLPQD